MQRRTLLQAAVVAGTGLAAGNGLLWSGPARAATSPFEAQSVKEVLQALTISAQPENSTALTLTVPPIAEDGGLIPVTVTSKLEGTTQISLLVEKNLMPLAAIFNFPEGTKAEASTRIKMRETSAVIAIAKVGDKTYQTQQEIKVTVGGCGG